MAGATERKPPYIAESLWKQFFEQLSRRNVPPQFTVDTIKGWGIAKGQENALYSALAFMEFVESDGKSSEKLRSIAAGGDDGLESLSFAIDDAYSGLFEQIKIDEATYDDVRNYFAHHHSNASARKMVRSLICLARMVGWGFPFMSEARAARTEGVPKKKRETKPSPPLLPERTGVSSFDPVELAKAMEGWDVEKMKVFFEELEKLREVK